MTRRALLAILALIAGFVVSGPGPGTPVDVVAVSSTVDAAHLPGTTARATNATHPVQVHPGQPLDGVQPAVHVTPAPPVRVDVVDPTHHLLERNGQTSLGERAPPVTSGS